jgi:hypothetical protein
MDALKIASGASEKRKRPCKASTGQRINEAVLNAQKILGEYIETGPLTASRPSTISWTFSMIRRWPRSSSDPMR